MGKAVMVVGTASNVGKSVLCTALCRILHQDGYRVAPFKSQNMSLNSAVTPSGREIGRAQAVQAAACGILPNEHMNPVLLKPTSRDRSQVVIQGRVYDTKSSREYYQERLGEIWQAVVESYTYLVERHDVIVIEGAGSPVEMNLKPTEIANMRTAEMADADVLLVADIDRGGIFASVVGTMQLLSASERARVKGIIVNKFQGDPSLFDDGVKLLESYTGVPVLGVIPYVRDVGIEEEDSMGLQGERYHVQRDTPGAIRVAIVQLPHISNFNDFDPLFLEPGVDAFFCQTPDDLQGVHVIILPGTKNTLDDLAWLHEFGWIKAISSAREQGTFLFGICGGYQMLGRHVQDPYHQESAVNHQEGLDYLPVVTEMAREKSTILVAGQISDAYVGAEVSGYEIHMGVTSYLPGARAFARVKSAVDVADRPDGCIADEGRIIGTYLHGIFDNDDFRGKWLASIRVAFGLPNANAHTSMIATRDAAYDRIADVVRRHLDLRPVYEAIGTPKE
ncbi:cobyric acid synthase [Alicyclobacillus fastidiosus]|uniref:Cobyric acid synthase n=1 Tax=Alicyclobacillus fastidiosus TaxID=392011 RepID=A0ABY6ZE50_9BACL|nr:cobyric acid synthase [Alicyclobacillus fastidiosus]WAH41117.1 cobyric acid synthase [Alicyclobacillus fastidiosus]GMA62673.1 cobyric acid synthase [Alicyclobacillus fastidiosus]